MALRPVSGTVSAVAAAPRVVGFERGGELSGTQLRFSARGTTYSVASESRVAPGQTAFNLYVLFQPGWRPTHPNANLDAFQMGAADTVEYLPAR